MKQRLSATSVLCISLLLVLSDRGNAVRKIVAVSHHGLTQMMNLQDQETKVTPTKQSVCKKAFGQRTHVIGAAWLGQCKRQEDHDCPESQATTLILEDLIGGEKNQIPEQDAGLRQEQFLRLLLSCLNMEEEVSTSDALIAKMSEWYPNQFQRDALQDMKNTMHKIPQDADFCARTPGWQWTLDLSSPEWAEVQACDPFEVNDPVEESLKWSLFMPNVHPRPSEMVLDIVTLLKTNVLNMLKTSDHSIPPEILSNMSGHDFFALQMVSQVRPETLNCDLAHGVQLLSKDQYEAFIASRTEVTSLVEVGKLQPWSRTARGLVKSAVWGAATACLVFATVSTAGTFLGVVAGIGAGLSFCGFASQVVTTFQEPSMVEKQRELERKQKRNGN